MRETTVETGRPTDSPSTYSCRLVEARSETLSPRRSKQLRVTVRVPALSSSLAVVSWAGTPASDTIFDLPQKRPSCETVSDRPMSGLGSETVSDRLIAGPRSETVTDRPVAGPRSETVTDRSVGGPRSETLTDRPAVTLYKALGEIDGEPRQPMRRPLLAVPVLPDGAPDWDRRVMGMSSDLSTEGIGLVLDASVQLHTTSLMLLLEQPDGTLCCEGVEVPHGATIEGGVRIGGLFSGFAHELLRPENLTPTFEPDTKTFGLPMAEEVLEQWAKVGVLEAYLWDRIALCPQCHALPTFRQGCPSCGSSRLVHDQLIHHFACAHVGFVGDFEVEGELICPKCRTRQLVVASDYEYCSGPYRCVDCHWNAGEPEQVGQCLGCKLRFPGYQSHEQELKGYRAQRLPGAGPSREPAPAGCPPEHTDQDRLLHVG